MHGRALAAALLLLVVSKLQEPDAAGGRAIAITPPTGVPLFLLVSTFPLPDNVADTLLEDGARSMVARLQTIAEEVRRMAERDGPGWEPAQGLLRRAETGGRFYP